MKEIAHLEMKSFLDYANAAASISISRYGAIPSMPEDKAVLDCMQSIPVLKAKTSYK